MRISRLVTSARRRLSPPSSESKAEVGKYREKIAEMRASLEHWKTECERLTERIRALQAHKRDTSWRRHEIPSTLVLHHLFHARAAAVRGRLRPPWVGVRDALMIERSPSYRQAIAEGPAGLADRAERIEIGKLEWWVPRDARTPESPLERWLPFRAILQTREVSVGRVMLDIGANVGRTSIPRVILGDVEVVYAAEPDATNYACLVQTILANGLQGYVLPDRVVIGAREGPARLLRSPYIGGHRVLTEGANAPPSRQVLEVPSTTVDRWTERLGVDDAEVAFVKVDTQGWELQVLLGAERLRQRRHIGWQIEVDPHLLRRAGSDPADLYALLESTFTHFIDVQKGISGPRVRRIPDLRNEVAYLGGKTNKTDLILYSAPDAAR